MRLGVEVAISSVAERYKQVLGQENFVCGVEMSLDSMTMFS